MKQSPKSVKQSSFTSDVLKLVSGTAFAQALTILSSPFLTRLYSPEDFGTLALFLSITSIIGVISCLRYELAIMLPESDEEAANLLGVSLCFVVLISFLSIPTIWLGRPIILDLLKAPQLSAYLWLVPPMVFFSGVFLALNYWNSRTKHFGRLSVARVFQSVTTTGTQIGSGYIGYGNGGGLIGAGVLGSAVSSLILSGQIWRDDSSLLRQSINWCGMKQGVERYSKFPLYDTWASLLNTISWQLPALLLSAFFSASVAGYYALTFRLMSLPMNFIGQSIGQVFFQRASVAKNDGKLEDVVEKTFSHLFKVAILPISILTLIAQDVFVLAFGEEWRESGVYLQILGIWSFFWFISSPVSSLFPILERQKDLLYIQIGIFVSRLASLTIGGYIGDEQTALALFSISGFILYGYLNISILTLSGVNFYNLFIKLLPSISLSLFLVGILALTYLATFAPLLIVIISLLLSIFYYYFIFKINKEQVRNY